MLVDLNRGLMGPRGSEELYGSSAAQRDGQAWAACSRAKPTWCATLAAAVPARGDAAMDAMQRGCIVRCCPSLDFGHQASRHLPVDVAAVPSASMLSASLDAAALGGSGGGDRQLFSGRGCMCAGAGAILFPACCLPLPVRLMLLVAREMPLVVVACTATPMGSD